ncbi:hypothetical protein FE257_004142 [Aspergillus nanangensis]|uniref:GET complex, subunit GET2 n=1 Tax=Aspergillus nanangensis TaxID=2582783 RepID=A0AAD4GP77_ASPNN|nr:hypothetical protein FE257_004142 [Aspergillus nanangensis]
MSSAEESPAQRAARLRRERREAKIRDGGAARLDKITSMGGRTPQSVREATSPSPSPSPQPPASVSPVPETRAPLPQSTSRPETLPPPEDLQAQQEYIRTLLRQSAPQPSQQQGPGGGEDPMMKMLNSLMDNMPGGEPGAGAGAGAGAGGPPPGMSPGDLASSLGLPPFVASMLGAAAQPQSEQEKRVIWTWKLLHVLFSISIGVYLFVTIGTSIGTYGSRPPPPATAQSPFLFFTTGELLLTGSRVMMKSRNGGLAGMGLYLQLFRDIVRDGSVVVFLLGMSAWWHRDGMTT